MEKTRRKLGAIETAQAITNMSHPFNVVAILKIVNGPAPDRLKEAANRLLERHPLLGARIIPEKNRFYFQFDGPVDIPLNIVPRETEKTWQQITEEQLHTPTDFLNGPLFRIDYVTRPGSHLESEIILTFHHAVMDAASGGNLLDELLTLCTGELLPPPMIARETFSFTPPAEAFFPPSHKGMWGRSKTFFYLVRMMGDELGYRVQTAFSRKAPIHLSGRGKILPMTFSKEASTRLWKKARKKRITMNSLFDAALLMAVHRRLYNGTPLPLRFFTFADLRPFLIPPLPAQTTGSYFSMLRFTTKMQSSIPLHDLAQQVQKQVYTSLKRGDKFCAYLQSAGIMKILLKFKSFRMGTTALSYTGKVNIRPSYDKIIINDLRVFTSNFGLGPEYTAQTRLFQDQFCWDILYLDTDMDETKANEIADDIRQILETFAQEETR